MGDGKCFEILRMLTSSSSEKSEVLLRSLWVGTRGEDARFGWLLFQLDRPLAEDREEAAVFVEA